MKFSLTDFNGIVNSKIVLVESLRRLQVSLTNGTMAVCLLFRLLNQKPLRQRSAIVGTGQ